MDSNTVKIEFYKLTPNDVTFHFQRFFKYFVNNTSNVVLQNVTCYNDDTSQ